MIITCLDIETTGLDADVCRIIEISKCEYDTELDNISPVKTLLVYPDDDDTVIHWEKPARAMHKKSGLFKRYEQGAPFYNLRDMEVWDFIVKPVDAYLMVQMVWSDQYKTMVPATVPILCGKSVGWFDMKFLTKLPHYAPYMHNRRVLDINAAFVSPTDTKLYSLAELAKREGLPTHRFQHHKSADDAMMCALLMRKVVRRNL